MQLINAPGKLVLPFANSGAKNSIPVASQIGITAGAASLTDGFPPLTRTPLAAGGVPPSGLDMNGILFELSAILRWANAGGGYPYDSGFANDVNVGGYPKGSRVMRSDGLGYWLNTKDNNTTNPESAGAVAAGWVPDFTNGVAAITMTGSNATLTTLQYGKPIIVITGLLTANLNLIFPSIVGKWIVINNTTGPYTITCKTAAGTGVVVNSVQAVAGDATNIYSAVNDAVSSMGELIASAGGTADALTVALSPAWRAWPNGVPFFIRAASANATTTPTFTPNSGTLTAKTIVKGANAALAAGDIAGAGHWLALQYDATLDKVVLLNPATGVTSTNVAQIRPITASVASNILTINVPAGSLDFHSTTQSDGAPVTRTFGALSLAVPAAATLGVGNGLVGRLLVLAIDNAGTVELAVVNQAGGNNLDEVGVKTTTTIGAGSTANNVIYSTTGRTGVAYRVIGFVDAQYTGATGWATTPATVQGYGGQALAALQSLGMGQTWQVVTGSRAVSTTYYNTTGKPIVVHITATSAIDPRVNGVALGTIGYGSITVGISFIVPPGQSYSNNGASFSTWSELR